MTRHPGRHEGEHHPPSMATVEQVVRHQISMALGGRRGMLEAATPTLMFTFTWLGTKNLTLALGLSLAAAVLLLVVRLVQRSSTQFVFNALFGIAIGWVFVRLAARGGGSVDDQALAFFLPGILWSSVYSVLLALSCVTRWPMVGFLLGNASEDPLAWHGDRQIVRLCSRLTWVLGMPGMVGVALQGPVWLAGWSGAISASTAVLVLGTLRFGLGWPLRFAAFAWMAWLLGRNHTPLETPAADPAMEPTPDDG